MSSTKSESETLSSTAATLLLAEATREATSTSKIEAAAATAATSEEHFKDIVGIEVSMHATRFLIIRINTLIKHSFLFRVTEYLISFIDISEDFISFFLVVLIFIRMPLKSKLSVGLGNFLISGSSFTAQNFIVIFLFSLLSLDLGFLDELVNILRRVQFLDLIVIKNSLIEFSHLHSNISSSEVSSEVLFIKFNGFVNIFEGSLVFFLFNIGKSSVGKNNRV